LVFRNCEGKNDHEAMAEVTNRSWAADLVDAVTTASDMEEKYAPSETFDPAHDLMIVESKGSIVGLCEVYGGHKFGNVTAYSHLVHLLPEWRLPGIRESMLELNEARIREIAATHAGKRKKVFEIYANSEPNDLKALLEKSGYKPSWYLLAMLRSLADPIPDHPLPKGVDVRPASSEHYRAIWDATREAMRDESTFTEESWNDEAYERSLREPTFCPHLWQIAWEGDRIAGGVHNYIDETENRELGRKWGHTEQIFVRRPWRRKGLARALISRSCRLHKEKGMDYATLDMEAENPSGALRLYESFGYRKDKEFIFYRKPL